jgi:hypothetical protein
LIAGLQSPHIVLPRCSTPPGGNTNHSNLFAMERGATHVGTPYASFQYKRDRPCDWQRLL